MVSSINRLTSPPDSLPSKCRRSRHTISNKTRDSTEADGSSTMASCHQLRYVVSLHCTRHAILQPLYSARHSSTFSRASSRAQNLSHIVLGLITHCRQKVITLCSELIAVHATV